jgi:hypothetical protein
VDENTIAPTFLGVSMYIDSKLACKVIRKALKTKCKTLSVRIGRGTAYGWIDIRGSGRWGEFTEAERKTLDEVGLGYGANFSCIPPENREFWVEKLCKLVPEAEALLIAELLGKP